MRRNKSGYASVIGLFHVVGKITGRQFVHAPMVGDTLTADAFTAAGFIGTIAIFHIF
jgi:hypothetical protein